MNGPLKSLVRYDHVVRNTFAIASAEGISDGLKVLPAVYSVMSTNAESFSLDSYEAINTAMESQAIKGPD